jgi:excisionase family DNA binding protein
MKKPEGIRKPENEKHSEKQEVEKSIDSAAGSGGVSEIEYLLLKEAAAALKASEKTIIRRLKTGEIEGVKDKGRWLIDKTAFKSYLNGLKKIKGD